ncbi:hypothetical protein G6011_08300 [Alternaria panax]|uniref:Uncharacterized protein n=1 Tax=Alternaria panax TaxID=48097 RepID=A0AAD4I8J1_9PLEO|nr:hypothetical protein G6011_08300 [Alternaria panax]
MKTEKGTGASGAAWSEGEKITCLMLLCENEGNIDAKMGCAHPCWPLVQEVKDEMLEEEEMM